MHWSQSTVTVFTYHSASYHLALFTTYPNSPECLPVLTMKQAAVVAKPAVEKKLFSRGLLNLSPLCLLQRCLPHSAYFRRNFSRKSATTLLSGWKQVSKRFHWHNTSTCTKLMTLMNSSHFLPSMVPPYLHMLLSCLWTLPISSLT